MKTLLIVNPDAGRMRRLTPLRLVDLLESFGLSVTLVQTTDPREALSLTTQAVTAPVGRCQRVVVAGGDGTIHAVLPALEQASVPLAILPVGSVNVLARELGIPRFLPEAARIAARGVPRPIDLGRVQGEPFVLMAGFGFDAAVVQAVKKDVKKKIGVLTYVLEGLRLLFTHPAARFRIVCDNKDVEAEAWQVVVSNTSSYTYRWRLAPEAKIDDGFLEVCIIPRTGTFKRIWQVKSVLLGKPQWAPVSCLSGRRIEIQTNKPVPVQSDGEFAACMDTVKIEVIPQGLMVMTGETK